MISLKGCVFNLRQLLLVTVTCSQSMQVIVSIFSNYWVPFITEICYAIVVSILKGILTHLNPAVRRLFQQYQIE